MKTANKKKEPILAAVANHIATQENDEWPPQCAMFLYQPKRPLSLKSEKKADILKNLDSDVK